MERMSDSSVFCQIVASSYLSAASSGSFCFSPKLSTPKLFFLDPRSTGYGNRCFQHSMEIQTGPPASSIFSHTEMYSKIKQDQRDALLITPVWKSRPCYPLLLEMLIDIPALLALHAKLLHLPMFPSQVHPLMKKKINLAV